MASNRWLGTCDEESGFHAIVANEIFEFCPCIEDDMNKDLAIQPRPKGWGCYDYCQRVLGKGDGCLCFCVHHRDECPSHGRQ